MTTIRAKFKVISHTTQQTWNNPEKLCGSIKLMPVSSGSDENRRFYEATPGGSIDLMTVNHEALKALPIGAEVYVDFTVAPAAVAAA